MAQTPDALAREWFETVWNRLDESAIDRLLHPDSIVHGLAPEPLRGPAAFKPFFHTLRNALGNIRIEIERSIVQGDTAVVLCHVTAKHAGDALGGPASGNPVDFWGMTMVRAKDGLLIEGWNAYDFLTMYQQMGWITNPVQPQ